MGGTLQVLTHSDIVGINRRMITKFGGVFFEADSNLTNRGSLDHVLEQIQYAIFGHESFGTIVEKAAAICWRIITSHVFHDGNKRTGMEACRLFLELNGYTMRIDSEVVQMALRIAEGKVHFAEFVSWVEYRSTSGDAPPPGQGT